MVIFGVPHEVWFPVVSVLLGFLGKGVLDAFGDNRRARLDAETRRQERSNAAKLRRVEFQRSVLIELQEVIQQLGRFAGRAHFADATAYHEAGVWGNTGLPEDISDGSAVAQGRAALLSARLEDRTVAEVVDQFRHRVTIVLIARNSAESENSLRQLTDLGPKVHEAIGVALRRLDSDEFAVTER